MELRAEIRDCPGAAQRARPLAVRAQWVHHMRMFEYSTRLRSTARAVTMSRRCRALVGGALLSCGLLASATAGDNINCSCVANGQRVELGELFCIRTASGKQFLARCERVLNNTSWKRLQEGCPSARNWSEIRQRAVL